MTREEAIEILKAHHMWTGEPQEIIDVRKENKALEMAIQALSQEPCSNCCNGNQIEKAKLCQKSYLAGMEHKQEPTDTWSIKDVADTFKKHGLIGEQEPCEDAIDRAEAMTEIMMFAGNVKSDEEDIYIKVSDAVQLLRELPSATQKPIECEDAVSREAVLQAVSEGCFELRGVYGDCEELINALPSVTQKSGKWIGIDEEPHEDYECSCCGYVVSTFTANIEPHTEYKYCPNCGAKMESER